MVSIRISLPAKLETVKVERDKDGKPPEIKSAKDAAILDVAKLTADRDSRKKVG